MLTTAEQWRWKTYDATDAWIMDKLTRLVELANETPPWSEWAARDRYRLMAERAWIGCPEGRWTMY